MTGQYLKATIVKHKKALDKNGENCLFYKINVHSSNQNWKVYRRYSDFEFVYNTLNSILPRPMATQLKFPGKRLVRSFFRPKNSTIRREKELNIFLQQLVTSFYSHQVTLWLLDNLPEPACNQTLRPECFHLLSASCARELELALNEGLPNDSSCIDLASSSSFSDSDDSPPIYEHDRTHKMSSMSPLLSSISTNKKDKGEMQKKVQNQNMLQERSQTTVKDYSVHEKENLNSHDYIKSLHNQIDLVYDSLLKLQNTNKQLQESFNEFLLPCIWQLAKSCQYLECGLPFYWPFRRRHHCRRCGYSVCHSHSNQKAILPGTLSKPSRICDGCHDILLYRS